MNIFKRLSEKGYKHYTENTVEELDELLNNHSDIITEYAHLCEWLRVNHGIFIHLSYVCWSLLNKEAFTPHIAFILSDNGSSDAKRIMLSNENSPQEAYSAAFDYILNNDLI